MRYNLIVAYDLINPGQNYDLVRARIKQLGLWYQLQYSLFYVSTELTPQQAHAHVSSVIDANDKLLVVNAYGAVVTPLPLGDIDALNNAWFPNQTRALPYATTA